MEMDYSKITTNGRISPVAYDMVLLLKVTFKKELIVFTALWPLKSVFFYFHFSVLSIEVI